MLPRVSSKQEEQAAELNDIRINHFVANLLRKLKEEK
jgi:hypothetical protein